MRKSGKPSLLSGTKNRNSTLHGTLYKCTSIAQYAKELYDAKNFPFQGSDRPLFIVRSTCQPAAAIRADEKTLIPEPYLVASINSQIACQKLLPDCPINSSQDKNGSRKISTPQAKTDNFAQLPPAIRARILRASTEDPDHKGIVAQIIKYDGGKLNGKRQLSNQFVVAPLGPRKDQLELSIQRVTIQKRTMKREKLPKVVLPKSPVKTVKTQNEIKKEVLEEAAEEDELSAENKAETEQSMQEEKGKLLMEEAGKGKTERMDTVAKKPSVTTPVRCKYQERRKTPEKKYLRGGLNEGQMIPATLAKKMEKKEVRKVSASKEFHGRGEHSSKLSDVKTTLNASLNTETKAKPLSGAMPSPQKEDKAQPGLGENDNGEGTSFAASPKINPIKPMKKQCVSHKKSPPPKPFRPPKQDPLPPPKPRPVFATPDFYTVFLPTLPIDSSLCFLEIILKSLENALNEDLITGRRCPIITSCSTSSGCRCSEERGLSSFLTVRSKL